ncbi:helix-turn-helix domain-containing protein [Nitratidesulfovibrio liaohensis]|uniref:Helix-turn-helix domain-containing protein n=1 Tax=Nitratidesulfovibrio liaohensis TaxID=2604158 RepID=A0ABY9R3U1_9BACT|nr:helix-turn-helix domain-containing protein [Nitratidesulfovibrio liaohensis]WMW65872.1 helix-turn-helix domain-containing protein [Nitratidesulfovibrio liaohensis]
MALKELGIALREAREAKGLDIDDVAIRIKVSARVLRAIEDGEQDQLPHSVYARGFIKSYAALLGVDNDLVMRAVDEAYPFEVPEDLLPEAVIAQPQARGRIGLSPVVLALALLVVLAALGGGWYYSQRAAREADLPKVAQPAQSPQSAQSSQSAVPQPAQQVEPQSAPVQDAVPAPDAAPAANATSATVPAVAPSVNGTSPATGSTAQPARNASAAAASSPVSAPAAAAQGATPAAAPSAPATPAAVAGGPQGGVFDSEAAATGGADTDGSMLAGGTHRIVVIALADCWVHSSADDSDVRQFSLHKGQTFALTFSKRLTLKLGNAGGVRIRYNGQEQPAPGDMGQVRTLVFPPQAQ